ncbi:MAG: putative porin, partial [Alistipes sp.]
GVGVDLYTYSQFSMGDYVSGRYTKVNKTSYFAYGSVAGKIKKYVDWSANLKFYPSGYRSGDLSAGARLALTGYIHQHPLILEGRFTMERRSPNYWQENLFSNHYVWFTPLNKENETRFEVKFSIPDFAFEAGAWQSVVSDKIYYAANSNVAQKNGNVSLTSVYARKDFRIGGFHLDNRVLLQWSTDQEVVPVPLCSAFISYYYEFWVKRDVLRLQIGVDGRFNTRYYSPGYNPALSQFYNQREVETGNYPYMDVFVTGKWKRMRVFLKYQHLNKGLFGNGEYFAVAHQPLNPGMFKMGISWGFYD